MQILIVIKIPKRNHDALEKAMGCIMGIGFVFKSESHMLLQ